MPARLAAALALCATLLFCGPTFAQDKPDPATPKGAASAFLTAMETGDTAAAKAAAIGDDAHLALLDTLVPMVHGLKQLETAAVKKWGENGRKAFTQGRGAPGASDLNAEMKNAREQVDGDTATIVAINAKPEEAKRPMKLRKVDGKWKVDLASMRTDRLEDPSTPKVLAVLGQIAKATATEIGEGKYATPELAREAMNLKMASMLGDVVAPPKK